MKEVEIYTDGACSHNPGPGGWGAILLYGNHIKEISGAHPNTTNNRMELTAAIESLKALKEPCRVTLYSDSAYLVNCFEQKWHINWKKNNWRSSRGSMVENKDLWEELLRLTEIHQVKFVKVKGHADNQWNNRADELATSAINAL